MKRFALLTALAALVVGGSARADVVNWNYAVTGLPTSLFTGTSAITFFPQAPSSTPFQNTATNNISNVVVATIGATSSASSGTPDTYNATTGAYSFQVAITSGGSTSSPVSIGGTLTGPLWANGDNLSNAFTSAPQSVSVGGNSYLITPELYTSPSGTGAFGTLAVQVAVTFGSNSGGGGGGGSLADTPEPTSLMLSCLGLTVLGAASWRKRRRLMSIA